MRSRVDLPQPEGPDQDDEFAVLDFSVHAMDHLVGLGAGAITLDDVLKRDGCHYSSLNV